MVKARKLQSSQWLYLADIALVINLLCWSRSLAWSNITNKHSVFYHSCPHSKSWDVCSGLRESSLWNEARFNEIGMLWLENAHVRSLPVSVQTKIQAVPEDCFPVMRHSDIVLVPRRRVVMVSLLTDPGFYIWKWGALLVKPALYVISWGWECSAVPVELEDLRILKRTLGRVALMEGIRLSRQKNNGDFLPP